MTGITNMETIMRRREAQGKRPLISGAVLVAWKNINSIEGIRQQIDRVLESGSRSEYTLQEVYEILKQVHSKTSKEDPDVS